MFLCISRIDVFSLFGAWSLFVVTVQVRRVAEENGVNVSEQIKELEKRAMQVQIFQFLQFPNQAMTDLRFHDPF